MRDAAIARLSRLARLARDTANLMIGLPDYERYRAHRTAAHPDETVMSRAEFFRERTLRRYEGGGAGRCC